MGKAGLKTAAKAFTVMQYWTDNSAGLLLAARDHDFQRRLKKDDARFWVLEQGVADGCYFYRSTAQCKHQVISADEFLNHFSFETAECSFPLLCEDFRDRGAGPVLEHAIGIEKMPLQLPSEQSPDGRLAGAHESHEHNTRDAGWQLGLFLHCVLCIIRTLYTAGYGRLPECSGVFWFASPRIAC